MPTLALTLLALAANPPPTPSVTLAFPGLNAVNLVAGEGALRTEVLAQRLTRGGIKVVTSRDLAAVLGLERQQQLLGCTSEGSSCAIEMLAAAGTDAILVGDLGNLGGQYTLAVKAIATKDGKVLAQYTGRGRTESEVSEVFEAAARALLVGLLPNVPGGAAVGIDGESTSSRHSLRAWSVLPAAVGVLAIAGGVVFQVLASGQYQQLKDGNLSVDQATTVRNQGQLYEGLGVGLLIGGGVALAVAALLYFLPGPAQTALRVIAPSPTMLAGVWP